MIDHLDFKKQILLLKFNNQTCEKWTVETSEVPKTTQRDITSSPLISQTKINAREKLVMTRVHMRTIVNRATT
jgi:hypothetical protein